MKYRDNMTETELAQLNSEIEAESAVYADATRLDEERYQASLCKHPMDGGFCAQPKGHEADDVEHALVIDSEYIDGAWPDPVRDGLVDHRGRP